MSISDRLQEQQKGEFQANVEFTVVRGKRTIHKKKMVNLPRRCSFQQGKAVMLKAHELEENKWELVNDDRDIKRRSAEYVGGGEDRKRVFTATQLFRAYTVDVTVKPYFYDPRIERYSTETVLITGEEEWEDASGTLPWTPKMLLEETMNLSAIKLAGGVDLRYVVEDGSTEQDPEQCEGDEGLTAYFYYPNKRNPSKPVLDGQELHELQIEGAHAAWELAVEPEHHFLFQAPVLKAVLDAMRPGVAHLNHLATAAAWQLCISARPRAELSSLGAVPVLLEVLESCMGPPEALPGLEEHKQQMLEEWGARQWLQRRGPRLNPEKIYNHEEKSQAIIRSKSGDLSALSRSSSYSSAAPSRTPTMKRVDTAAFLSSDSFEPEESPKQGTKKTGKGRKKAPKKKKKSQSTQGTPKEGEDSRDTESPGPSEMDEDSPSEVKLQDLISSFERKHLDVLTPNRRKLILGNSIGALSMLMLDEAARASMFERDPHLEMLISLAMDSDAEDELKEAHQRMAMEIILNIITRHRDKEALITFVGGKKVIPSLCDLMEGRQSYTRLCASIVFTYLLNTPGVPEAIAKAGHDSTMFKRLVDALCKNVPELLQEMEKHGKASEVMVNLVNSNAAAIWKSSLACLPPHGKGFENQYLIKLVEASDKALNNPQVMAAHHALSGVFAHMSRDRETAAQLVKIDSMLSMLVKFLRTSQSHVRICAIAAVGNLGSHGAEEPDPLLPPATAFLKGAYREYLACHILEDMQLSALMGCPDADDESDLHHRLEMVAACASMWLASTPFPTREDPSVMDRLLEMTDMASGVNALVYFMPTLWLMARSDFNREYLVTAPHPSERSDNWRFHYTPSDQQFYQRLEKEEEFSMAWRSSEFGRQPSPEAQIRPTTSESGEVPDPNSEAKEEDHAQDSAPASSVPARTDSGGSVLQARSYPQAETASIEVEQENRAENSWCLKILVQVANEHRNELDGEEDEDSWVSQMFVYWVGAAALITHTEFDFPWEVEKAFELQDSCWWSVPPQEPDPKKVEERPRLITDLVGELVKVATVEGRGTFTVRRLVTGLLWNLATSDFGLEMHMVKMGLPEALRRASVVDSSHVKLRQWSAAFLHRIAQREGGGGWQLIADVGIHLAKSSEPLLVQQGFRMLVTASKQPTERLVLAQKGVIPLLLDAIAVAPLLAIPGPVLESPDKIKSRKRNESRVPPWRQRDFSGVTLEQMQQWISEKVTDPRFLLEAPEFDPHFADHGTDDCRERADSPFTRAACMFALFSLLNLSVHEHNRSLIARKGFRALMNANYFFKSLTNDFPEVKAAEEQYQRFWVELMCQYTSAVLSNCSKGPKSSTTMYRLELAMNRLQEQEGEAFNPLDGIEILPDPHNNPTYGLVLHRASAGSHSRKSVAHQLLSTNIVHKEVEPKAKATKEPDCATLQEEGELEHCEDELEDFIQKRVEQATRARNRPMNGRQAARASVRPSTAPEPGMGAATRAFAAGRMSTPRPRKQKEQGRRWGSAHSRVKPPEDLEQQKQRRKPVEDDKKRAKFLEWIDENQLHIGEDKPRYMHALPKVKPEEVGPINKLIEADMEAHAKLRTINQKLSSGATLWSALPNEDRFGARMGNARWQPQIDSYLQLCEKPRSGYSILASKLLNSRRPPSAFRRLTHAAEWVSKAAAEDKLHINGGHIPRPYEQTTEELESICNPYDAFSFTSQGSDDGETTSDSRDGTTTAARLSLHSRASGHSRFSRIESCTREELSKTFSGQLECDQAEEAAEGPSEDPEPSAGSGSKIKHQVSSTTHGHGHKVTSGRSSRKIAKPSTAPANVGRNRLAGGESPRKSFEDFSRPPTRPGTLQAQGNARSRSFASHTPYRNSPSIRNCVSPRPPTRSSVVSQLSSSTYCLKERLPPASGMWDEDDSEHVVFGCPTTVMLPPLASSETCEVNADQEELPLNLVLSPGGKRHNIRFNRPIENFATSTGRIAMFQHVPGSQIFPKLYPYYLLPNGSKAFFYYKGSQIADEIDFPLEALPRRPSTLESLYQQRLPYDPPLVEEADPATLKAPAQLRPIPPLPVPPMQHSLDVNKPPEYFGDLRHRPMSIYLTPIEISREEEIEIVEDAPEGPPWKIEDSVWAGRPKEMESRDFWDGEKALDKAFNVDWTKLTAKEKFMNFIDREAKKHKSKKTFDEVMNSVSGFFQKEYSLITRMYRYYSVLSSNKPSGMPLNDWTELLNSADIPNNESAHCKVSDCDTIFITANYMATKEKDVDENSLGRFQFVEAITRVAVAKYPSPPDEALKKLFRENLYPNLPPEAVFDPNDFRTERFYNEEVDEILTSKRKILEALHSRYRLPPKSGDRRHKNMMLIDFLALCTDCELYSGHFTERTARMCYAYAKPTVADEFSDLTKFMQMTLFDFMEALGHMADLIDLPTKEDLNLNGYSNVLEYHQITRNDPSLALDIRESAQFRSPKTRPLVEKLELLLDLIFRKLDYSNAPNYQYSDAQFVKKLNQIDRSLGP